MAGERVAVGSVALDFNGSITTRGPTEQARADAGERLDLFGVAAEAKTRAGWLGVAGRGRGGWPLSAVCLR